MAIKYRILLSVVTFLAVFFLASCTDDLMYDSASSSLELDESDIIDAKLSVSVNNFKVSTDESTRTEEPAEDEQEIMTDFEKQVDNICVFQFDEQGNLLIKPRYYTAEGNYDSANDVWEVVLKPNVKSKIYVVTNVAAGDTWVENYQNFPTEAALLSSTLPEPYTIYNLSDDDLEGHIPAKGSIDNITVAYNSEITVPVEHMFAKVKVRVYLDRAIEQYEPSVGYVTFTNSPFYCKVGTLYDDVPENSQDDKYPSATVWNEYPLSTDGVGNNVGTDDPNNQTPNLPDDEEPYNYVIYVPENIQGEIDWDETKDRDTQGTTIEHASKVIVNLKYTSSDGTASEKNYTVYPGGNTTNNFNVRRNQVYRVTVRLGYPIEEEYYPSANCIVGHPGTTISFEPYNREEIGGGYKFSDYLDPEVSTKQIKGLKILWQTEDCIGDNTDGTLVYIQPTSGSLDEQNIHDKIYVKVQKAGNAVIAAYNDVDCTGDILWSWHIWVTSEDPTNIGNAVVYYTYEWDSSTIYGESSGHSRVPGYGVMPCNLGSLTSVPTANSTTGRVATYGLVYQWGRKDPFPGLKGSGNDSSLAPANIFPYNDETTEQLYDNSNNKITGITGGEQTEKNELFYTVSGTQIESESLGVDFSIKNPTVFMGGTYVVGAYDESGSTTVQNYVRKTDNYHNSGDWLAAGQSDDRLWGQAETATKYLIVGTDGTGETRHLCDDYGKKSIYDPCPYGWRVSPPDQWLGFTNTGFNPINSLDEVNYDSSNTGSGAMAIYIQAWRQGAISYFPTPGTRAPNGSASHNRSCGNYHNATTDTYNRVNILHIHNSISYFKIFEMTYFDYYQKSVGGPIRCVRDTR